MNGKFIKWENGGGFGRSDWSLLYKFIRDYEIESVLEYGCGLSTELMLAVGLRVTTIETRSEYADIPEASIIVAPYPHYPELHCDYDMAFVDGPGAYEFEAAGKKPERTQSVKHAALYANYIYMHDGGLGQEEVIKDDYRWKKIRGGDSNIIYGRLI